VDESRKRVLQIAASILAARKLAQANWDGKPSTLRESAVYDAISTAECIMQQIDDRWPERPSFKTHR